jgi:hypothetical protein
MTEQQTHTERVRRPSVGVRLEPADFVEVEKLAAQRRTSNSQIIRCLVQDALQVQRALDE